MSGTGMVDELTDEEMKMMGQEPEPEPVKEEPEVKDESVDAPKDEPKEPEKEEPKKEEPKSEDGDEDEDGFEAELDGNKGRFVRHGAFHKAREKWKSEKAAREAAQRELGEYRERTAAEMARVNERLAILAQLQNATQQKPAGQEGGEQSQVPNPETHPFEYMRYLGERLEKLGETQTTVQQRFEEQDSYSQLQGVFKRDAMEYVKSTPDFGHAYQFLLAARDRELARLGYTDPSRRAEVIAQEEARIVAFAIQHQKSPSELVYALAQDRGYQKPAPQPSAEELAAAEAAKAAEGQPQVSPETKQPTAAEQIKQLKTAAASQKSLSSAAGGGGQVLTAEALANMDDAEFDKIVSKLSPAQRREIFGDA